jgi:cytoskeletal protein CcmA (bactofilin family)
MPYAHHLTMLVRVKKMPSDVVSVIGSGFSIEGHVRFSGVLRVDGTVRGKISALPGQSSTLIVGVGGRVDGDVAVRNLVVHGTVNGVITQCDKLELASTARLTGHLYYASIDVSPGAIVQAQLVSRATIDQAEAVISEPSLALARP